MAAPFWNDPYLDGPEPEGSVVPYLIVLAVVAVALLIALVLQ